MKRWMSWLPGRHFVLHYLEMVVTMVAGMMLLGPVWTALWPGLVDHSAAHTLVMAVDMTAGMGLWMWIRGASAGLIVEMSAAMVAPLLVLLVPHLSGALSGHALMMGGHMAMPITMLAAMLIRRDAYDHHHGWRLPRRRQVSDDRTAMAAVR